MVEASFLHRVADRLLHDHGDQLWQVEVVLPNRRTGLFLRQILAEKLDKPALGPSILSLEQYFQRESERTLADPLQLISLLHEEFLALHHTSEGLDSFFFWGEVLLKDFDELDRHLADVDVVLHYTTELKELDSFSEGLTEDQLVFLQEFWGHVIERNAPEVEEKYLGLWRRLKELYRRFESRLAQEGLAYQGMLQRQLAEALATGEWEPEAAHTVFAGFNALTKAEQQVLRWFVQEQRGTVLWDYRQAYLDHPMVEAGLFLRRYAADPVLGKTFDHPLEAEPPELDYVESGTGQGQVAVLSDMLAELRRPSEAMVVLAHEQRLPQLLLQLPQEVKSLNVTMGFPFVQSQLFRLLKSLMDLKTSTREYRDKVYVRFGPLKRVLTHPMVAHQASPLSAKAVFLPVAEVVEGEFMRALLQPWTRQEVPLLDAVVHTLEHLGAQLEGDRWSLERAFVAPLWERMQQLRVLFAQLPALQDAEVLQRVLLQVFRSFSVPFSGEPLEGMQVMGLLESRSLDYRRVFVVDANEGRLPKGGKSATFLPYKLRRAFQLPLPEEQEAIAGYLFYRLFHRSQRVTVLGLAPEAADHKPRTRFLNQMAMLDKWPIHSETTKFALSLLHAQPVEKPKDAAHIKALESGEYRLSPTAIVTYLTCPLKYYFEKVARLSEADEPTEVMAANTLGNVAHLALEWLYTPFLESGAPVTAGDLEDLLDRVPDTVQQALDEEFSFFQGQKAPPEGENLLVRSLIEDYVRRVLELDRKQPGFVIQGLEEEIFTELALPDGRALALRGFIDRVDMLDGVVRILDYKTGSDELKWASPKAAIDSKGILKHKAQVQTLLYAHFYLAKWEKPEHMNAGLFALRHVFAEDFSPLFRANGKAVPVLEYLEEFRKALGEKLQSLLSAEEPFTQTDNVKACEYCPYNTICQRG